MDIHTVIQFICGLAFFLFGMNTLSQNLEIAAGHRMESILRRVTASRTLGFILGLTITVAIQSSSAVSVMLVGLVNSGLMQFSDTLFIIFGTNIGTTVTAWILSLTGIEETSLIVTLLKPENFSPVLAIIGVGLIIFSRRKRPKYIGAAFAGFAVLIYGMKFMTAAIKPLSETAEFSRLLISFKNPILSLVAGIVITALVQSSSASIGILQAFALTGALPSSVALPVVFGQNIGTCITTLISAIGSSKSAKRVAVAHTAVNVIGAGICLIIYFILRYFTCINFDTMITPQGIAVSHTLFNIVMSATLMPFSKQIISLTEKTVK